MISAAHLGVVILGAGASSRMGCPKLLLPWGESSVVGHIIGQWRAQCAAQIAVVCGPQDAGLTAELERLGLAEDQRILNPSPETGMFSSVICAASWSGWQAELTHWVITLGDQPQLKVDTLRGLIEFAGMNPELICQPSWNGRPRHPIVFPKSFFLELQSPRAADLKVFLQERSARVALCPMDDPGLDQDLDTPADYRRLRVN